MSLNRYLILGLSLSCVAQAHAQQISAKSLSEKNVTVAGTVEAHAGGTVACSLKVDLTISRKDKTWTEVKEATLKPGNPLYSKYCAGKIPAVLDDLVFKLKPELAKGHKITASVHANLTFNDDPNEQIEGSLRDTLSDTEASCVKQQLKSFKDYVKSRKLKDSIIGEVHLVQVSTKITPPEFREIMVDPATWRKVNECSLSAGAGGVTVASINPALMPDGNCAVVSASTFDQCLPQSVKHTGQTQNEGTDIEKPIHSNRLAVKELPAPTVEVKGEASSSVGVAE